MNHRNKIARIRKWLGRIAPDGGIEELAERDPAEGVHGSLLESVGGSGAIEQIELANDGIRNLVEDDEKLTEAQVAALEAIILPNERPVTVIQNGRFGDLPAPWKHLNSRNNTLRIQSAIPSIGRVEFGDDDAHGQIGTGFVVGRDLLMTNRHVAAFFSRGRGRRIQFLSSPPVGCDFLREQNSVFKEFFEVVSVRMVHPHWDMAILEVSGIGAKHTPLNLSIEPPDELQGRDVAVIGYPVRNNDDSREVQEKIFQGGDGIKRLAPGKIGDSAEVEISGERTVRAMTHDSSTLGGNSGSAVIDISNGDVVGLHFAGIYLKANYSVPTWELARDSRVVDAGLNFRGSVAKTREWDSAWNSADSATESIRPRPRTSSAAVPHVEGTTITIPLQVTISLGEIRHSN